MRIGIYGGSFDPPHVGHAMVAAWLLWTRRVDQVWLVPAFHHAFDKPLRAYDFRVAMCRALTVPLGEAVCVSTAERELPGPSYTFNTLTHLAALHPEHRFQLVVGADVLAQTHLWHRWPDIEAQFAPIRVGRGGYPPVPGAPVFPSISSTAIRAALSAGEPVDHLLTAEVCALITDQYA